MKGETNSAGFTIVETILVLAVTSMLFVMVALTFSGKQHKAEFQQAARDIQTKVQQVISQVSSGYFPNTEDFTCIEQPANNLKITSAPVGTVGQGQNEDCVLLGKMMQFRLIAASPEPYNVYSIAGLRKATTLDLTAQATVIDGAGINVTEKNHLYNGLTTKWMKYYTGGSAVDTNTVGFMSRLGSLSDSTTYESSAVDLVALTGTSVSLPTTATQTINLINSTHLIGPAVINPDGGVKICFQSGGTTDTALLSIGSNGHNLAVKLEVNPC